MKPAEITDIEVDVLIETLRRRHGYDFSNYARASLKRRIQGLPGLFGCRWISELLPRLLHEEGFHLQVVAELSVPVTEMFRDPPVFLALRQKVVPVLHSYPRINVWQVGCATGEEAYSLAILFKEEGLAARTQIYATDINDQALAKAEEGIFPIKSAREYSENYMKSGGRGSLSDYYFARYDFVKFDDELKKNIVFAHHNVVSDGIFCECNIIICRNVLIYFDRDLQGRVLTLFRDSLARGGFLCLGNRETLQFSPVVDDFRIIDREHRIYQEQSARHRAPGAAGNGLGQRQEG